MPLKNFFVQCSHCKENYRFDYVDQVRTCPQDGTVLQIAEVSKRYLAATYPPAELVPQE